MKVNIYYGGRGIVDDPTIFVVNKLQEVLLELHVSVGRYNLYEMKNEITALSQTVTEADAVILATTVEWIGMGGYMQTFLDACWLYADRSKISDIYMFPAVLTRSYGEKEVALALSDSWEMLGGKSKPPITAYVEDTTEFEFNAKYIEIVERYAENIYRTISQKRIDLPSSNQAIKKSMFKDVVKFTPEESEQLSRYASDDTFVKTQKQDIETLASIYKELLTDQENGGDNYYLDVFKNNFVAGFKFQCSYLLMITDKNKNIIINVKDDALSVEFGSSESADVIAKMDKSVFDDVVDGTITFHRAFMTGDMSAKGNLKNLKMLDELFRFKK